MGLKRSMNIGQDAKLMVTDSAPVNGTSGTGAGSAGPGSILVRAGSTPRLYVNRNTKASPTWRPATQLVTIASLGRNGAGALTLTGSVVGDRVVMAYNMTDLTDGAAAFETEITVADQIQQSSASDLSAKKHVFILQRG